jgi:hypothetical protein
MKYPSPIDYEKILNGSGRIRCQHLRGNIGSGECARRKSIAEEEANNPRLFWYRAQILRPTVIPSGIGFCLKCRQNQNPEKSGKPDS